MPYLGEKASIALLNFGMRFLKCVSQVRELFRYTPRYLTLVVFIFCPLGNKANKTTIHSYVHHFADDTNLLYCDKY